MRTAMIAAAAALLGGSTLADAQLLGGRAGVGAGLNVPSVDATVGGAAAGARDVANSIPQTTARTPSVDVKAGVSTRVDRGTRCYYQPDDDYYEPVYRDGYYYCERRGSGAAAGASVATPR